MQNHEELFYYGFNSNDDFNYTYDNISSEELDIIYKNFSPVDAKLEMSNVEVGIIHLCLSLSSIILQLLVFSSFYNDKELFKKTCFQIIFNHGVLCFIQQICHILTSIITIFLIEQLVITLTIIGSILTTTYIGSTLFILLLTLNRLDIIYDIKLFYYKKNIFYLCGIILCYIYTISILILYMVVPEYRVKFNFPTYEWIYENSNKTDLAFQFEKYSVLTFLGISFVLQFLIFLRIFFYRCSNSKKNKFVPDDFKIIIHGFLCFATTLFLELIWDGMFFQIYWLGSLAIIPHILFIFSSVTNSVFILCFVRDIRTNTLAYKYLKNKVKNSTTVKSIKTTKNLNVYIK